MSEKKALLLYKKGVKAADNIKYEKAIKLFDEALSINPEYVDALNKKAFVLVDLGRTEEIQIINKAYNL